MVRGIQARRVCAVGDAGREFDGLTHGPIAGDAGFCDEADGLGDFVDRRDGFEAERALVTVGVLGVVRVGAAVGGVVVDGHGLWCWWGFGVVAGTGQGGEGVANGLAWLARQRPFRWLLRGGDQGEVWHAEVHGVRLQTGGCLAGVGWLGSCLAHGDPSPFDQPRLTIWTDAEDLHGRAAA